MKKNAAPKIAVTSKPPPLTKREHEIYNLLLKGSSLKEISYKLNIQYDTVYFHQRNLFRKLNIENIHEFLIKHLQDPSLKNIVHAENGISPVFTSWKTIIDNDSSINLSITGEQNDLCYEISGTMNTDTKSFAGIYTIPESSTLELMKKMTSFSFNVSGDENYYVAIITTSDTRKKANHNHYHKLFKAPKDKVSTIHVKISDLSQNTDWGNKVKFNQKNAEVFQFNIHSTGDFYFKIWDIKFYL
ncbi:MAG: helix-turn-helix transcriptional regulator [Treponema sp.]|nr:helix-turn-helix transcriptional regulator [Treponema sp.]